MYWYRFGLGLLGLASLARALDPVEVKGNKFFNKDGSQFFIKGKIPSTSEIHASTNRLSSKVLLINFVPRILLSTQTSATETSL